MIRFPNAGTLRRCLWTDPILDNPNYRDTDVRDAVAILGAEQLADKTATEEGVELVAARMAADFRGRKDRWTGKSLPDPRFNKNTLAWLQFEKDIAQALGHCGRIEEERDPPREY